MASNSAKNGGIIILGNAGSGKSFLCNILIGSDRFESAFRVRAVTMKTELHRVKVHGRRLNIFNIPGLVDPDEARVQENIKEIKKAFKKCPNSIVLYVWSNSGGRCSKEDLCAFKALYKAYKFPKDSLAFVINNLDPEREKDYDAEYMVFLEESLAPQKYPVEDFVFIEKLPKNNSAQSQEKIKDARLKLMQLIASHYTAQQTEHENIDLESPEIKKIRAEFNKKQDALLHDQTALKRKIDGMNVELRKREEQANKKIQELERLLKEKEEQLAARRSRGENTDTSDEDTDTDTSEDERSRRRHEKESKEKPEQHSAAQQAAAPRAAAPQAADLMMKVLTDAVIPVGFRMLKKAFLE